VAGGGPPTVMRTLARHRGLFRPWLRFAARLMPGGVLPRKDTELLILRVAHNCGSEYEWRHHEHLGRQAGLSTEEIERVREGAGAEGWSGRRRALLEAADELHADRDLSDATWAQLREHGLGDVELIELCMLVGHYEMLAMTLNALRVQPDGRAVGANDQVMRLAAKLRRIRA
jgi:alkylhydroperoxidase family enzyme